MIEAAHALALGQRQHFNKLRAAERVPHAFRIFGIGQLRRAQRVLVKVFRAGCIGGVNGQMRNANDLWPGRATLCNGRYGKHSKCNCG